MAKTIWGRSLKTLSKAFFIALIGLGSLTASAPSPEPDMEALQCLVSAVYHEARGEPAKGKRAVLEVVLHRSYKSGKHVCEVVAQKRQFPWFKKKGLVELKADTLLHYNDALLYGPVLKDERFLYFNGVRPFGHSCRRIGKHTFCKEK